MRLGRTARSRVSCPGTQGLILPFLVALAVHVAPRSCAGTTAIVPDDYPTVQLGIDSGADSIVVRAGTYPERVTLIPPVPRVLLADPAAAPRPTLQGLTLHTDRSNDKRMTVIGIHVLGGVQVLPGPYGTLKVFEACSFDSGIGHGPHGPPDTNDVDSILVRNCTIRGDVQLRVGQFTMESDTVAAGGVSLHTVNYACSVRNCWFRGPGTSSLYFGRAALSVEEMAPGSASIAGNVVENCQVGMGLAYVSSALIEDNVVRNCQIGISVRSGGPSSALNKPSLSQVHGRRS